MPRIFTLKSPLNDELLFSRLTGTEQLGALFEWDLIMYSERTDIRARELLGKGVTIDIETEKHGRRYLNALVTRFRKLQQDDRYTVYHAELRPWLWYARLSSDCRIFQHKTVVQIADEVLAAYPFPVTKRLSDPYKEIGYCVQYNETDFDFLSRLFEQEGIYYYFEHRDGTHALVLADYISAHKPLSGYEQIRFVPADRRGTAGEECVHHWEIAESLMPARYATSDYDFKKPLARLQQVRSAAADSVPAHLEMYRWGHGYTDPAHGEHLARVELERLRQDEQSVVGLTNARGMAPGGTFKLSFHPDEEQNADYLVTGASYRFEENSYATGEPRPDWSVEFTALRSATQYRPVRKTPRPSVSGIHTAKVVGPPGEEIWCDQYGRVKLQFPWDRHGKSDENSSCWVRVSSPWAGGGFGGINVPRIGQEVLVEYINGDINRPVIVGRVYNDFNMPPWALPAAATVSGLKSNTHKGSGYNELSMDDTAGNERITLHGQHDMDTTVRNNQTNTVHNDQTNIVKRHRSTTVETGHDTLDVLTGERTITVRKDSTHIVQDGHRSVKVTGGDYVARSMDNHASITGYKKAELTGETVGAFVTGKPLARVHGADTTECVAGKKLSIVAPLVQIGNETIEVQGDTITLQCGKSTIRIEKGQIVIQSGSGTIKLDAKGVSVNGTLIELN